MFVYSSASQGKETYHYIPNHRLDAISRIPTWSLFISPTHSVEIWTYSKDLITNWPSAIYQLQAYYLPRGLWRGIRKDRKREKTHAVIFPPPPCINGKHLGWRILIKGGEWGKEAGNRTSVLRFQLPSDKGSHSLHKWFNIILLHILLQLWFGEFE